MDIPKLFNERIPAAMASHSDTVKAIGAKYQLNIGGEGGGKWFLDCTATGPRAEAGEPGGADCTVKIDAEHFAKLLENPQANGVKLFFTGKLKVEGNPVLATKLLKLLELMQ